MWLIAGLGNPDAKSARNRHNVGFMIVDEIADSYQFAPWVSKFNALTSAGMIADQKVLLVKPQSYMNRSGQPVGEAAKYFKIPPEQILICYDELDLPLAKVRIKKNGGSGGHNGIKSLDSHLGKDYWRLRFGIDHPGDKNKVSGYVLSDFSKEERTPMTYAVQDVARTMPLFFEQGPEAMMTKVALLATSSS